MVGLKGKAGGGGLFLADLTNGWVGVWPPGDGGESSVSCCA